MSRRWVAAGCNTKGGEGSSLHRFPREQQLHAKWVQAVKLQRSQSSEATGMAPQNIQCYAPTISKLIAL